MLNEVPADAPDRDMVFTWQAEGSTQPELQDDGNEAPQPYVAARGARFGLDRMSALPVTPYSQHLDVDATYRIVATEEEADEFPLDDDEVEVIVGSRQFDLVELIEEELLLALPLVPKHDVCPTVHESLVSGVDGSLASELDETEAEGSPESVRLDDGMVKPNPFAVLSSLKQGGSEGNKH